MDTRTSFRDKNRNATPPRQAPHARVPARTGIVILLLRPGRTRRGRGSWRKLNLVNQGHERRLPSRRCIRAPARRHRAPAPRLCCPETPCSGSFFSILLIVSEQVEPPTGNDSNNSKG